MVDVMASSGLAEDIAIRQLLVQSINGNLPHPLTIRDQTVGRHHLIEIVNACAEHDGGPDALIRAVRLISPGSRLHDRLRRLVHESQVRDLLPPSEIELLRQWLTAAAVPQLPTLVRRAAGFATVHGEFGSAWDAVGPLADLNVAPDGFPPLMLFVELVAGQLGGVIGEHLMRWNDDQARRLGIEAVLRARRTTVVQVPREVTLHLLIVVQPDGIDQDRCLVSHWRQDDPDEWPPPPGDPVAVFVNELEECVDELVVAAERAWSGHQGAAALEIVLPRALLNLPIHRWFKERRTGSPRPLCLEYPIVVRSLERMRSPYWHRAWRRRWQSMVEDPSPARVHFVRPADVGESYRIDALLSDLQWVMVVLSTPPADRPRPGADELTAALQAGLPALVWHPLCTPDELREIVGALVGDRDLINVPASLKAMRQYEYSRPSGTAEIVRHLILLWDDPNRLVLLDQSYGQPPRGDNADERERAS